jgi:hypothetical protein
MNALSSGAAGTRGAASLKKATRKAVKSVALCAFVISMPQLALAADTTINTAETTTQGPTTPELNGGDTLTIGPAGSVTVTGTNTLTNTLGILSTGSSNTITNSGSITTLGDYFADGIYAAGGSNTITNSGSISTTGADSYGIYTILDFNTITNSGSISTTGQGGLGISSTGSSSTITNSGLISTSGDQAAGIDAIGNSNLITNTGSIRTTGSAGTGLVYSPASGIRLVGSLGVINNSGSISTAGRYGYGILAFGSSNTIANSGSISTTGRDGLGIYTTGGFDIITGDAVKGNSNSITNSGSINTAERGGRGIYTYGNLNAITNSGSIRTAGENAHGIEVIGDSNATTNSGLISASGSGAYGIKVTGNSNTITNSGSIVSREGYAIYFSGTGNTLNSLNNFIAGGINMGTSGTVNFTTGANYSKLYTFEGTLASINSSGPVPLFTNLSTNQAGTYDPTIFASSSDALADMTSTISSLTPGRFNGSDKDHPLWVRGFGMASSYEGTDATLDRSYNYSGVAIGYDFKRSKDLSLGVLGGYGQTSLWANAESTQSFNTNSDDGFLGLYGQKRWKNVAVDFALYGGLQSFQQQRYVNDNLAYLGNSSANASYQGWWIAPEAGITYNAGEVNGWSFLPTARLRYAQQWMGGYTETGGGSANATVNGRNVAIGQSFVGIGTRKTMKTRMGKDTKMVLHGQVGYIYRGVVGDDSVNVTMIGQSQSLATESSSRNAVAVSAGVTLDLSSAVALKIRGDFAAGGGMQYGSGGWAGLSVKF